MTRTVFARTAHAQRPRLTRFLSATALTAAGLATFISGARADDNAWTNFEDVSGSITIDTPSANDTYINQHTQTYIGNSNNLDILEGQSVTIGQNDTGSLFVGRSTRKGSDPTRILGTLNTRLKDDKGNATDDVGGSVMVLDRNGVLFGANSRVDVGGIIVSTGDVLDADILDGDGKMTFSDFGDGGIDLQGTITVADAGLAAFVSPSVKNSGVINAKMGTVVIASAEKVTLDMFGDGLFEVTLEDRLSDALIENTGTINAQGGTVIVKAEAAKDVVDNIINMDGVVNASSATVKGGKIILGGGGEGIVKVSGKLDASGATGGGEVAITGENVEVTRTAEIKADATDNGDGGEVLVYGDKAAAFEGHLSAKGGAQSGNGGNAEISGGETVGFNGLVDLSAANGETGTLLIDPKKLIINDSYEFFGFDFSDGGDTLTIYDQALANTLGFANVNLWATEVLKTGSDIDISTWEGWFGSNGITANTLTLAAPTVRILHDVILGTGNLSVADMDADDSLLGLGLVKPPHDIEVEKLVLDGRIYARNIVGGATALASDSQLFTTADVIKVKSAAALIQQAVHFADETDGDAETVNVAAGTYEEQVDINKSLSLVGAGKDATIISAPVLLNESFNNGNSNKGVVYAHDAEVINISDLTIDGQGRGNGNYRLFGLLYKDAGGTVDDVHVTRVTDTPVSGSQHGNAVMNYNTDGSARTWTVQNSTIDSFQKNGITANGAGLTANILNNTVTGNGALGLGQAAQNGIQVSGGALGNIDGNTVSNISYTPRTWAAAGILVDTAAEGTSVTNNIIHGLGDEVGIYAYNTDGMQISGNTVDGTSWYGLLLYGADGAVASGNTITGAEYGIDSYESDDVEISGNTVDGNGNGINGISVALGNNATVTGNTVTGNTDTPAGRAASDYTTGIGILISDTSGTVEVSANTANNNIDGIRIRNTDGALIEGNTANNNQDKGIIVKFADHADVLENTATGNDIGLYLDGSADGEIRGNTLSGNTQDGIHLRDGSNNAVIANNFIHGNGRAGLYAENLGGHAPVTNVTAFDNSFSGNAKNIINTTAQMINASGNYWGTTSEAAVLASMTGSVDFTPYLMGGTDSDGDSTNGFQGDFSDLFVTRLGGQTGTTGRIQEGIDLIVDGALTGTARTVNVGSGTFNEGNINIAKAVLISGAGKNNTIVNASGYNNGFEITDDLGNVNVSVRRMTVENASQTGLRVSDTADLKVLQLNQMAFKSNGYNGVAVYGDSMNELRILNSDFLDNGGANGSAGDGDILAFLYNGDVTLTNVTVENNTPANTADYGIQIRGADTPAPSGSVVLNNVKVAGDYRAALLGIQRYDTLDLSMTDVMLGGQTAAGTDSKGWGALYLSELGGNDLDIGNTAFGAINGAYITLGIGSGYFTTNNVDARDATFEGLSGATATVAQNFAIEDKIFHKMDNAGQGLVTWHDGNVYVTSGTAGIQNGIDSADAGDTVHVDGSTYQENLLIDKSVKLTGHDTTLEYDTANDGPGRGTAGNLITITADNVNIDPFNFVGDGLTSLYAIDAAGADGLIVDGNSFTGFVEANIRLSDSNNVRIFGNTMTGAKKGIIADNTADIWVHTNWIDDATVAGVHLMNTNGTDIWNDADIWNNTINNAAGATGILVENSNYATIGAHETHQPAPDGLGIGNKITGGANGVVALNSDNAMVRYNTISGQSGGDGPASGDGVYVADSNNVQIRDNDISNVADDGIQGDESDNIIVAGNNLEDIGNVGIAVIRNSDNQTITGNKITNAGGFGIRSSGGGDVTITGNEITGAGTDNDAFRNDAIHVDKLLGAGFSTGLIDANKIDGAHDSGIEIENIDTGLTVSNNEIENAAIGVYNNGSDGTVISSNMIGNVGTGVLVNPTFDADVIGNTIDGAFDGVRLVNSSNILVEGNTIANITDNGVEVSGGDNNDVIDNDLDNIGWDGIQFVGSTNGEIRRNEIDNVTGASAIAVMGGSHNAVIRGNDIDGVDRLGIYVWNSDNLSIRGNDINDTGREGGNNWFLSGIHLENSSNTTIRNNDIDNTGGDGIHIGGAGNGAAVATSGNRVINNRIGLNGGANNIGTGGGGGDGVFVSDSDGVVIKGNDIANTVYNGPARKGSGILVVKSDGAVIGGLLPGEGNVVTDAGSDGIVIRADGGSANNSAIIGNTVNDVQRTGVYLEGTVDTLVHRNVFNNAGISLPGNGVITAYGGGDLTVTRNDVNGGAGHGIEVKDLGGTNIIRNNDVDDVNANGIFARNVAGLRIVNNDIGQSGPIGANGILVENSAGASIRRNDIADASNNGIQVVGSANVDVLANRAVRSGMDGVSAEDSAGINIRRNVIRRSGDDGIDVANSDMANVINNRVRASDGDGIELSDSDDVRIQRNTVRNSGDDGIDVDDAALVEIDDNNVTGAINNGIEATGTAGLLVTANNVLGTGDSGIYVDGSIGALIAGNDTLLTGDDGIEVRNVLGLGILGNDVALAGDDGIDVDNVAIAAIANNTVAGVLGNGIEVDDGALISIEDNMIAFAGGNGIDADGTIGTLIAYNDIAFTGGNGIRLDDSTASLIVGNDIFFTLAHGIDVDDSALVGVAGNDIGFTLRDGIHVDDSALVGILGNEIAFTGGDGVDVEDSDLVAILGNTVDYTLGNGIEFSDGANALIALNNVGQSGFVGGNGVDVRNTDTVTIAGNAIGAFVQNDGIYVNPSSGVEILSNVIDGVGANGIHLNGNTDVLVDGNTVSNSGLRGLYASGQDNGSIVLTSNVFTDNPVGAEFESGLIDLTAPLAQANRFIGGDTGLVFDPTVGGDPSKLALVDDTIGTTIFEDFTDPGDNFIVLANEAFFAPGNPTILNGLNASYNGFVPPASGILTQAQYDAIESRIFHYIDDNTLGLFFFGAVPGIDQEDILRFIDPASLQITGLNVTIRGLPQVPGGPNTAALLNALTPFAGNPNDPAALNAISPAAGGGEPTAAQLAAIDPAAGGASASCWGDAAQMAQGGQVVSVSYSSSPEDLISASASCASGI